MSDAACPHCGGLSGRQANVVYRVKVVTSWDGKDSDHVEYTFVSQGAERCQDCGKSVTKHLEANKKEPQ